VIADSIVHPAQNPVALVKLSPTEWRGSDTRVSVHDAASLLGFIEARGRVFEVTIVSRGVESYTALTLEGALALFSTKRRTDRISPNVGGLSRTTAQ
jgi:hypothetical protein